MPRTLVVLLLALFAAVAPAAALQREKPPVPDLTAGGQPDDKHDWNLGPTGARGWIWGWKLETTDARQVLVTAVAPGSPADGLLQVGDVILGVGDQPFERDARRAFGDAITAAEAADGRLVLLRWRAGETEAVSLPLVALGAYAPGAPWDCPKSAAILERACAHIAANMKGDIDGMVNALALLATGEQRYRPLVRELALEVAGPDPGLTLEGRTSGLYSWRWGYRAVFLAEYVLATGDRSVMPALVEYASHIARGQSGVGTWGHGMAWPDLNEGRLHGRLGGYGALNQAGMVCHLALVLARECGLRDDEVDAAIERANRFAAFYVGKGAIPYGDHRPGWDTHDDNGKNSLAALIFDLQGLRDEARFFAKMTAASYAERERGHTGNYFSYLWGPLGVARVGADATAAFLGEQRWAYDLARTHDGGFVYQGGAGMSGGEHQYGKWDCTGAFVLASTLPRGELYLTGKGGEASGALVGDELQGVVAAGRGFDSWSMAREHYAAQDTSALLAHLESWSPAVRSRAAEALAGRDDDVLPELLELLASEDLDARYGACQALGALGDRSADAVPALVAALEHEDVWLRIQAAYALANLGDAARSAVPALLRLSLRDDPADPRGFTQRYMAFCLFYPGGALGMRGLLGRSLDGVDRELLLPAIERLLQNDDGRARAAVGSVYKHLTLEELTPLLPAILESIRTPSPSGVMFANGIRLDGLELFARHRIAEGMPLCIAVTEIDQWGKQDRIVRGMRALALYGGAARPLLPELRDLIRRLGGHREAKNLGPQLQACQDALEAIEADEDFEPVRSIAELIGDEDGDEAAAPAANKLKVFILAGQSNMVGAGQVEAREDRNDGLGSLEHLVRDPGTAARFEHLVDEEGQWVVRDDVWISYFERQGPLTVGYGSNASTIGPELGFGHVVGEHFEEPVLLLKVAWGGKSIGADFRPPSAGGEVGPSYTALFEQVAAVLGSLDARFPGLDHDGHELLGIAWHQGWNDRVNQAFNDAYEENLACFIRDARRELGLPELPFVIAETGMSGHEDKHPRALSLMAAQAAVAEREEFRGTVAFVGTKDFWRPKEASPSGQAYHWNSNAETYYLIGDGLGRALLELLDVR